MPRRARAGVRFFWLAVAAALVALWSPPALAGQSGHRIRHAGVHHPRLKRHGKADGAKRCANAACAAAPARAVPARST